MKIIVRIVFFAVLALSLAVGLWFYLNGYLSKSKASNSIAHILFSQKTAQPKAGEVVSTELRISADSGMSGIELVFNTAGTNLDFSYDNLLNHIPAGFELILDKPTATGSNINVSGLTLRKLVFVSKNPAAQLPRAAIIPLYFKVSNTAASESNTTVTLDLVSSLISGVSAPDGTSISLSLEGDVPTLSYSVTVQDPRAGSVTGLQCDVETNLSKNVCGRSVALKWNDSPNEDGYKIYKNDTLVKSAGKDANSFIETCENFLPNTYKIIAYNTIGSVSTSLPTVSCGCLVCPTPAPLPPTPYINPNSADIVFRLSFPDAKASINEIKDVTITVKGESSTICDGNASCTQVVKFTRVLGTRPNTFQSDQISFGNLPTTAYTISAKQIHTLKQTYKHVYLKKGATLKCFEQNTDAGCGELASEIQVRPLFSGDLDMTEASFNVIDIADQTKFEQAGNSQAGDLNFDGVTDNSDIEILGKNLSRKGT